jgi:CheY-like chemotaxis protein
MEAPKLRALVVEDEALVAMLLEDQLDELGHVVVGIAGRIEPAKQMARDLDIDLAVIDLNLNGQQTYPVAHILVARGVPFIFATGYGAAGLTEAWAHAVTLQKPFQPPELAAAIARAMSGAGKR